MCIVCVLGELWEVVGSTKDLNDPGDLISGLQYVQLQ